MTQVCAQRHKVATEGILFPSSSSDKIYKVTAYRPNEFPFCSCPSYIFQRSKIAKAEGVHQNTIPGTCKHLQKVLAGSCDWRQDTEEQYQFNDICPKCAGPLVEEGDYSIPEDPTHAVDDLRALMADLSGEEAPAPLPKPEPYVVEYQTTIVQTRRITVEALDDGSGAAVLDAWKTAIADLPGELISEADPVHEAGSVYKASDAPKPKKPRKAAAKKATARTRQVDVTGLVQGAKS